MSIDGGPGTLVAAPPLPRSIWVVAWASVVAQLAVLLQQGVQAVSEVSLVASVVLGALVVGYIAAGVVRARTVRLVIAWVVLVLSLVVEMINVASADDLAETAVDLLLLTTTVAAVVGLASFRRSDWFAWQRTRPSVRDGAPVTQLVAIGVLVGVLGGLTGAVDDGYDVRVQVADRPGSPPLTAP